MCLIDVWNLYVDVDVDDYPGGKGHALNFGSDGGARTAIQNEGSFDERLFSKKKRVIQCEDPRPPPKKNGGGGQDYFW